MGLLRRHQLVSMFQQYLTDTLENTDRKKNFPTKQADTISKRNKQTNLSNETVLSAGNNQNFSSRKVQAGRWCLTICPGWENVGVPSKPLYILHRDPTKQNQTMTHQEASVDAYCISQNEVNSNSLWTNGSLRALELPKAHSHSPEAAPQPWRSGVKVWLQNLNGFSESCWGLQKNINPLVKNETTIAV